MLPSSSVLSTSIWVRSVSSLSEAVTSRMPPFRSKRKFSRIGSDVFTGIALEISINPFSSSELETLNFISVLFFVFQIILSAPADSLTNIGIFFRKTINFLTDPLIIFGTAFEHLLSNRSRSVSFAGNEGKCSLGRPAPVATIDADAARNCSEKLVKIIRNR